MLTLRCTLLRDVFEGASADDPRTPEWPPSWMRLYSALVSVARAGSEDDDLLGLLERSDPPQIHVPDAFFSRRQAFVPTNAPPRAAGGHTTLPGRTNGERQWARAIPSSPHLWYRWPDLELTPRQRDTLVALCRRVPYLGRSTSPTIVEIAADGGPDDAWLTPLPPDAAQERFTVHATVRSPFDGALTALREAHEEKFVHGGPGDPWQIGHGIAYGTVDAPLRRDVVDGPYEHVVVFQPAGGSRLDGRHTARLAHYLRRALMARVGDTGANVPAELHGHHDGTVTQIAFLGLVDVGHRYADGHLLGVALAVPPLEPDAAAALRAALPRAGDELEVRSGPFGVLRFRRLSALEATQTAGLRVQRWRGPSRWWATATPLVLDRFLKKGTDLAVEVQRAVRHAGLPDATVHYVGREPRVAGGLSMTPPDTLRRQGDRLVKPYRHVVIEFDVLVAGPVAIGSMRNYGLGLCVPHGGPP